MKFYSITWKELQQHVFQIAEKIASDNFQPDVIVTVARGGLSVAQVFSDYFDNCPIAVFTITSYKNLRQNTSPQMIFPLNDKINLKNKKVLFVDDLSDTGDSFLKALKHIKSHGANLIKTAAVVVKSQTKFTPDYFAINKNCWIIFPYEMKETTVSLVARFEKEGKSESQIIKKLKRLKIDNRYIQKYFR